MSTASSDILEDVEILVRNAKEQSRNANYYFAKTQVEKSIGYLQDALTKLEYEQKCKNEVDKKLGRY